MAIPPVFNSNTPFIIVAGGSKLSFLSTEDSNKGCEDEKDSLIHVIAPHLSRVMQQGTAKQVVTEGPEVSEENPCVSIVAQAQSEDFQEFSPTSTQCPYARCQQLKKHRPVATESAFVGETGDKLLQHNLQRKQHRKARTRQCQGDGEEPPVIRGLWVQEIDWLKSMDADAVSPADIIPPPLQFTDSFSGSCCHADKHSYICDDACSWTDVCDCVRGLEDTTLSEDQSRSTETASTSSSEDRGGSDTDCDFEDGSESVHTQESDSDSACRAEDNTHAQDSSGVKINTSHLTLDLMHMSGFTSCHAEWDLDFLGCVPSPDGHSDSTYTADTINTSQHACDLGDVSDFDAVLEKLRGTVTWMPKQFVSPLLKDVTKETRKDCVSLNEGLLFHHKLRPSSSQYREGEEYCILYHIQNGSYGDVFCVRDKSTGFKCAAKRIPLSSFSRDEVCSWSVLDSPRVVELFGAVRDGLNVVLFMDLKPACLAQLLKKMKCLPENLALHYLHQCLEALEHLHHRGVLHLDVKVDNVLLSADCRDTFLCDFGLSEMLDDHGWSIKAFRGTDFPGTETHMAPEVARGDHLCAKADVWSSCCMLLHMLNGCPPWIRYYSHPLCLQIVNEPPPLWEVPSTCNNFTAKVFRAGLQKDPDRRASARDLRRRTTKALRAVGGLSPWSVKTACEILNRGKKTPLENIPCSLSPGIKNTPNKPPASAPVPMMHWVSPWRTAAVEEDTSDWEDGDSDQDSDVMADSATKEWDSQPKSLQDDCAAEEEDWDTWSDSDIDMYMGEEEFIQERWLKMDKDYEADWEEEGQEEEVEEEEAEWDSSTSTEYLHALRGLFPLLRKGQQTNDSPWGSEAELGYLRDDVTINTVNQTPSPEPRDDPPSCFSCSDTSPIDASEKDSDHSSDDLSSGVFSSCNSQSDGYLEWLASANQPTSQCFEGVDIWIENIQGKCLRIREHRQVKVGHIAIGISQQMCGKAFTFETLNRKLVSFEEEIKESCVWLRCVPAPDTCQHWKWRVRDSKLEVKE